MFTIPMTRNAVSTFLRGERGAVTIEGAIMLPTVVLVYISGYTYFDAYRREGNLESISYTMSDALTRLGKDTTITPAYVDGLHDLFVFQSNGGEETFMRVTSVQKVKDELTVDMTYATEGAFGHNDESILAYADRIPPMLNGEEVIITELSALHEPAGSIGFKRRRSHMIQVSKTREGKSFKWDGPAVPTGRAGGGFAGFPDSADDEGENGWDAGDPGPLDPGRSDPDGSDPGVGDPDPADPGGTDPGTGTTDPADPGGTDPNAGGTGTGSNVPGSTSGPCGGLSGRELDDCYADYNKAISEVLERCDGKFTGDRGEACFQYEMAKEGYDEGWGYTKPQVVTTSWPPAIAECDSKSNDREMNQCYGKAVEKVVKCGDHSGRNVWKRDICLVEELDEIGVTLPGPHFGYNGGVWPPVIPSCSGWFSGFCTTWQTYTWAQCGSSNSNASMECRADLWEDWFKD
jgi:hypothetical protein